MSEKNNYQADIGSDAKKEPQRIVFITKKTSAKVKGKVDRQGMTYPHLVLREAIVLEVLTLAEHIGSQYDTQFLFGFDVHAFLVADRAKSVGHGSGIFHITSDAFEGLQALGFQLTREVVNRVGELREHQNLVGGVPLGQ